MSDETCPHGFAPKYKAQCSQCWVWKNSDAGRLFVAQKRIADLERAAETSRAEHAAALAEAESQLFDVRAERDDAREALSEADNRRESEVYDATAALGLATARIRELEGAVALGNKEIGQMAIEYMRDEMGMPDALADQEQNFIAGHMHTFGCRVVARIEKGTKGGTT